MQTQAVNNLKAPDDNGILSRLVGRRCESRAVVQGIECDCLLDSGSQVTTLSRRFFEENFLGSIPMRPLSELLVVEGAGGNRIPYLGFVEFSLELPELQGGSRSVFALVCEDTNYSRKVPLLVGTNVLEGVCATKGRKFPAHILAVCDAVRLSRRFCEPNTGHLGSVRFHGKSMTVAPGQTAKVSGISRHCAVGKPYPALLEGCEGCVDGLVVGCSLVTMSGSKYNKVRMSVYNPTNKPLQIRRNQVIANLFLPSWARSIGNDSRPVNTANIHHVGVVPPGKNESRDKGGDLQMFQDVELDPGLSSEWASRVRNLLGEYKDVFSVHEFDIGECAAEHTIHLTDDTPFKERCRPVRTADLEDARRHIKELLDAKVIQESNSPFASPIVLVRKKSGALRLTVDYRKLNSRTVKDAYSIPQVEHAFQRLAGAKWFSAIDLKSGFYHVKLKPEHRKYTAFTCPFGLFEFLRLPQGLTNSPATFQRMMETAMSDLNLEELIAFLDDLIIFSDTLEEHERRLRQVFERLRANGLKLSLEKCQFFHRSVKYLGHVVSALGISTDPDKIAAVMEWPRPHNQKELKSWLGFSGYYRRFIEGYAKIAQPLTDLLKGYMVKKPGKRAAINHASANAPFGDSWTDKCEVAFRTLQERLVAAPVLKMADPTLPYELHTDASFTGLGAALYQRVDGKLHPVAYASRSLGPTEKNYPVHKLEFLALKWAVVDKFSDFLYGAKFRAVTDNNPLTYVMSTAKLDACGHRWIAALSAYDFDIVYLKGKENVDADGLSRIQHQDNGEVDIRRKDLLSDLSKRAHLAEDVVTVSPAADVKELCGAVSSAVDGPSAHTLAAIVGGSSDLEDVERALRPLTILGLDEMEQAQLQDPIIARIRDILASGHAIRPRQRKKEMAPVQTMLRHLPQLELIDGVLHKKAKIHGNQVLQLVVPEKLRKKALLGVHDEVGHLGFDRCLSLARDRFYWVGMACDIKHHCQTCKNCILRKAPDPRAATLGSLSSSGPMDLVCVDFLSLEPDKSGKTDVLVITDHFSRYARAILHRNLLLPCGFLPMLGEGQVLLGRHGMRLHSDRGGSFTSKLVKELHKVAGIKGSQTTPYHPMGNGQVERFNRTLIEMLATLDEPKKSEWSQHTKYLTHAYNCTRHDTTNFSPFEIMFGRQPRLSVDWYFGTRREEDKTPVSVYVKELKNRLDAAYRVANENAAKTGQRNRERFNKKVKVSTLSVGDRVLVKNVSIRGKHKLANHWSPEVHVVLKQPGGPDSPVYTVRLEHGIRERTLHRNLLLPCGFLPMPSQPTDLNTTRKKMRWRSNTTNAPEVRISSDRGGADDPGYDASSSDSEDTPADIYPEWNHPALETDTPVADQDIPDPASDDLVNHNDSSISSCDAVTTGDDGEVSTQHGPAEANYVPTRRSQRSCGAPRTLTYDAPGNPIIRSAVVEPPNSCGIACAASRVMNELRAWLAPIPSYRSTVIDI